MGQRISEETREESLPHRVEVIRRLLLAGVSAETLEVVLPDWAPLIRTVATDQLDRPLAATVGSGDGSTGPQRRAD